MDWKIERDPYFSLLCRKHGENAAQEAGFFRDEDPEDAPLDDLDWLSTPRPKRTITGPRPVVLLATGGFFPVHAGHIEMMENARAALEGEGFDVIGGYLSPGHDSYIRLKCGDQLVPAPERLRQAAEVISGSDWLLIDPWEAMHRRVAVNYTDVTARLEAYLRRHVDPRVEVAYVCGGDNARFAYAFTERGRAVVVGRPGADGEIRKWRERLTSHPRVHWVDGANPAASRSLRSGNPAPAGRPRLIVRLEDARAVRTLGLTSFNTFQDKLVALLAEHAEVRTAPLREQPVEDNVISLDAMLPARHSLAVSRLFSPGG